MLLKSLELVNFRQFYGKQRIEFATDPEQNVTLIHGENGVGKTTLLNSILWCLFEKLTPDFQQPHDILCHEAQSEAITNCKVELMFEYEGQDYLAARHWGGKSDTTFKLHQINGGNYSPVPNPGSFINSVLPKDMAGYFFFHGEGISSISDSQTGDKFRRAIRDILGFTFAESAIDDLNHIKLQYSKRVAALAQESEELNVAAKAKSKAEEQVLELDDSIKLLTEAIAALEEQRQQFDERLSQSKNEDAKRLRTEIDRAERRIGDFGRQLKECHADRQGLIAKYGWALFGRKLASQGLEFIDTTTFKGKIPSPYQETFVKDLLDSKQCVCGRPLADGSLEQARVAKMIETANTAAISQRLMRARSAAANMSGMATEFLAEVEKIEARRTKLDGQLGEEESRRTDFEARLAAIDEAEIQYLVASRGKVDATFKKTVLELGGKQKDRRDLLDVVDRNARELSRSQGSNKQVDRLMAIQQTLDKMIARCRKRLDEYEKGARRDIAVTVNKILKEFSRKDYEIRVSETFEFHLVHSGGGIVARSKGENLLLNLAFVSALIDMARKRERASGDFLVQGTVAPFVIDAPFGELDETYKEVTAQFLPSTTKQLVLLLSSSHWKGTVDAAVRKRIGAEYVLISERRGAKGSKPDDLIEIKGRKPIAQSVYGATRDATIARSIG